MVCYEGKLSLRCFLGASISTFLLHIQFQSLVCTIFYFLFIIGLLYTILSKPSFQIAWRATLLGVIFASGCFVWSHKSIIWQPLGFYISFMAFFHYSEYYVMAISNPKSLSTDSFILNHSIQYATAAVCSWIEFLIEIYFWPDIKSYQMLTSIGVLICIVGEIIRKLAILTASSNFNHLVQFDKQENHTLVTHGIYRFMRHPSYVGWFWWSIGTQIILVNPICSVLYILVSWKFFHERINFEEITLLNFFDQDYVNYQNSVPTGLPFIKGFILEHNN